MKQIYFPNLETDRLVLRELALEDTEFIYSHFSDPAITQFLMDEPPLSAQSQAREIINFYRNPEGKTYNRWGIVLKQNKKLIGTCGYHKWHQRYFRAEIGYDLSATCWGQGYMTEALTVIIQNGFGNMGLNRIDALVYTENTRSTKLLHNLDFQKEGILRDYFYLDGKFYDHYLFSLLRKDWQLSQ